MFYLFRRKIFSNVKYFIVKHLQVFGKCCDINIANINQPPSATAYPTTTNHCKHTPCNPIPSATVIHLPKHPTASRITTNHQITTNHSKNGHQNHHQRFKKLPPTTKKTTTSKIKIATKNPICRSTVRSDFVRETRGGRRCEVGLWVAPVEGDAGRWVALVDGWCWSMGGVAGRFWLRWIKG